MIKKIINMMLVIYIGIISFLRVWTNTESVLLGIIISVIMIILTHALYNKIVKSKNGN